MFNSSAQFPSNAGRSVNGNSVGTMRYPSPFFDLGQTYLPTSFKSMLKWTRYYFLTNPIINAVTYKMAEYPVTDLVFESKDTALASRWEFLFNNVLGFKKFEVEAGLDYYSYGNTFISIHYPFEKMLVCTNCGHHHKASNKKYTFRDYGFHGSCDKCSHSSRFKVRDHYIKDIRGIKLVRWNPEYVTIKHNDVTGESQYYYTVPSTLANDIRMAKKSIIERVPQVFIDSLKKNKSIQFSQNNFYHLKRPTIAQKDQGWGMPMILPVLKDTFYLQILRKAQEAIAIEHITPLRIMYPATASGTTDAYADINLSEWKTAIEQEIVKWRLDNNYIPVLPVPIGTQSIGGDGRALMLSQEYRQWSEHIISGMGVPIEFYFGGMSFSGSSVSLRILENHFLDQQSQRIRLVKDFVMPSIAAFMGWETVTPHYRRFKMADDLQRSSYYFQLNQAGKISDRSLLEDSDWDADREREHIDIERIQVIDGQRKQALSQAEIQGEGQLIMAKYQLRSQKAMQGGGEVPASQGVPGSPNTQGQQQIGQMESANNAGQFPGMEVPEGQGGQQGDPMNSVQSQLGSAPRGGGDLMAIANKVAGWLLQLPATDQAKEMANMQSQNPQLYSVVIQLMQQQGGADASSAAAPAPEARPARRGPEAVAA